MDAVAALKSLEVMVMAMPADIHAEVHHCLRVASLALKDKREWAKRSGTEAIVTYALGLAVERTKVR